METDVLVIGSGVAGLLLALKCAERGADVTVVTKRGADDTSTNWAQGGIAAVFDRDDSFERHERDTLRCGAGLCDAAVVRRVVREAPERVGELEALGVRFSRRARALELGREGGHSRRRIVHAQDYTGMRIEQALLERVRAHPRVRLLEHRLALDLVLESRMRGGARRGGADRCWGAYVMDVGGGGRIRPLGARVTVLATGGCGKVYLYTSNPDVATGDGIAMAYRAGAAVEGMEFVQFHPTCLYHPAAKNFLLSEALRGEGAVGSIEQTIIAFSSAGESVYCDSGGMALVGCSDFYGNAGGDWSGCLAGLDSVNGNLAVDPEICSGFAAGMMPLAPTSPCLPPNNSMEHRL